MNPLRHSSTRTLLALLLTVILAVAGVGSVTARANDPSPGPTGGSTPTAQGFSDVPPGTPFYDEIMWLADEGITTGWPDGTYRPFDPISRDAMAAFVHRAYGSPAFMPEGQSFSDVAPDNEFFTEIEWLASSGITTGWPDGTYRPFDPISRDAMAAFVHRAYGSPAFMPEGQSFSDVAPDNEFFTEIEWLASSGITTGWPDGTYRPFDPIARDAVAAFLHRAVATFGFPGDALADADIVVAADGTGDVRTVSEALAAAPADASVFTIGIRPGTYRETLQIRRANTHLIGGTGDATDVVITYDNAARTINPATGQPFGTTGSATVLVAANDVTVRDLTFENSYVEQGVANEQAVAVKTTGDRLVFDNVRFLGNQDTLYADSPTFGTAARSYFTRCYVEGDVDFIFGRGTAVFDNCTLHALSRGSTTNNGFVTAASTFIGHPYGFLITDSTITSDGPDQTFHLGRPWQPSGNPDAVAQVVVRDTELPRAIKDSPWTDMTSTFSWRDARFFEYANTGAGAGVNADRPQLSTAEAAGYTRFTYLAGSDNWNPTGETPPADTTPPAAPAELTATASDGSVTLTWSPVADADLAGYTLYRMAGDGPVNPGPGTRVAADLTATEYRDRNVVNQTTYGWVVTAVDRAGNESAPSPVATATPTGAVLPDHDVLVAPDGSGDHTTVQAALDAAPAGTAGDPTVIAITPGDYYEVVHVTRNHITLIGTTGDPSDVRIHYDNAARTINPDTGVAYGTSNSQAVRIRSNDVTVRDLTIENSYVEQGLSSEQAVALHTSGDRLVFENVRLLGNQDTLLANSSNANLVARSYFGDSYIEGDVDFIFGRGTAVFDRSHLHALSRGSSSNNGYITAASTADQNPYGFLITDSVVTSNAPANSFHLGRPWRGWADGAVVVDGITYNSRGQVTIRDTELPDAVRTAQPWVDMAPNLWTDGRFFEYRNTGPGAVVPDPTTRPQLSDAQAAEYTPQAYLAGSDGWNPVG